MKDLYLASRAVVEANPPEAHHTALGCPDGASCLVVVDKWENVAAQDAWESLAGVVPLPIWDHGKPAPPALVTALADHGVRSNHTTAEALRLARRQPGWAAAQVS